MSVTFWVAKGEPGVEMANGTARVVLELLGLPHAGYLEGRTPLDYVNEKLAGLGEEELARAVVLPRQIGPGWIDAGTPRRWLDDRIEKLRELVASGKSRGASMLRWD